MIRFNQKIAKEIAQKQLDHVIDCVLGITDPDYHLSDGISEYEQNFEEDLQERGINPTSSKIEAINKQYERLHDKVTKFLRKMQNG